MKKPKEGTNLALDALVIYLKELLKLKDKYAKKANAYRDKINSMAVDYQTEDEINDAWGYGYITEEEREQLIGTCRERIELGVDEMVCGIIKAEYSQVSNEINQMRWDLLPVEERERINRSNEAFKQRLQEQKQR